MLVLCHVPVHELPDDVSSMEVMRPASFDEGPSKLPFHPYAKPCILRRHEVKSSKMDTRFVYPVPQDVEIFIETGTSKQHHGRQT